jgi:hypothetical protein
LETFNTRRDRYYSEITKQFGINTQRDINDKAQFLTVGLKSLVSAEKMDLTLDAPSFTDTSSMCNVLHRTYYILSGSMEVTKLDISTGIIAGTFEFDAVNDDCPGLIDTIHVTKGRFDIKYK